MSETNILQNPIDMPVVTPEMELETELTKLMKDTDNDFANYESLPACLFADYIEVEISPGVKKCLTYETFSSIFNKYLGVIAPKETEIKGILPPSNMIFMSQSKDKLSMTVYHPSGVKPLKYIERDTGNERNINIITPNIIISFTLNRDKEDWVVASTSYFCTDLPVSKLPKSFITKVDHSKGIYLLPMSNTYNEGRMCYGGNSMPARYKDGNLRGLDYYYKYLWDTPFNDDLGLYALGGSTSVSTWYQFLCKLARENKTFPYSALQGWRQLENVTPYDGEKFNRDKVYGWEEPAKPKTAE